MCNLTAYITNSDNASQEKLPVMESVTSVVPDGSGVRLTDIFGESKVVEAYIEALMDNKVYLKRR